MLDKLDHRIRYLGGLIMALADKINSLEALLAYVQEGSADHEHYLDSMAEEILTYHRLSATLLQEIEKAIEYQKENNLPVSIDYLRLKKELLL